MSPGGGDARRKRRMSLIERFLAAAANWQVFAVFILAILCSGLLLAAAVHRAARARAREIDQKTRDYAQIVYLGIFALTALMMTLSTLEARSSFGKVGTKVKEEAFNLVRIDRTLLHYGEGATLESRRALADYAKAVVAEDWPLMRKGASDGSLRVYDLLARLKGAIGALPESHGGLVERMLDDFDNLEQLHDDRIIAASEARLPSLFWWVIAALTAAICVLAGLLIVRPFGFVFLGVKLTAIALMVSFLAVLDGPFRGDTSVSPAPIVYAIEHLSVQ